LEEQQRLDIAASAPELRGCPPEQGPSTGPPADRNPAPGSARPCDALALLVAVGGRERDCGEGGLLATNGNTEREQEGSRGAEWLEGPQGERAGPRHKASAGGFTPTPQLR
jgi:hypothetical protein